jgi:hypothetical protein
LFIISANGIYLTILNYNFRKYLNKVRVNSKDKCDSESAGGVVTLYRLRDCRMCVIAARGREVYFAENLKPSRVLSSKYSGSRFLLVKLSRRFELFTNVSLEPKVNKYWRYYPFPCTLFVMWY